MPAIFSATKLKDERLIWIVTGFGACMKSIYKKPWEELVQEGRILKYPAPISGNPLTGHSDGSPPLNSHLTSLSLELVVELSSLQMITRGDLLVATPTQVREKFIGFPLTTCLESLAKKEYVASWYNGSKTEYRAQSSGYHTASHS